MKKTLMIGLAMLMAMMAQAQSILQRTGDRAQLVVNGSPMLILGAELSNSAATSKADIDEVLPRMAAMGVNTVLVPAQWDLLEPEEGRFDFSLIDAAIIKARECRLHLIYLWFGAWKNSLMCCMSCENALWSA